MNKISFPRFGKYTPVIVQTLKDAGFDVVPPPPITKRTIELGVKHAPSEVCFPLKVTLGSMIELLDKGVDTLMMISTGGWCVLRCYWAVQQQVLEDLGYEFKMIVLNGYQPFKTWRAFKKINPRLSLLRALGLLIKAFKEIKKLDLIEKAINPDSPIKIALLGEIYVCNEPQVNMDVVAKLQELGCYVDCWISLWNNICLYLKKLFKIDKTERSRYKKLAKQYFPELTGGHANRNIEEMLRYADEGYDGIICLKPMFCNPESIVETIFDKISKDYNVPVLQYSLDEFTQPTHFFNRVEAFVETIKLRKGL